MDVAALIERLGLAPHPEGGFFRETYRSAAEIPAGALPACYGGSRAFSTGILYLLRQGERSHLHRIHQDEMWHFYLGGPLRVVSLGQGGREDVVLGADLLAGHRLQHVVPGGSWFGAAPLPGTLFSLVGCTVAPGFDFKDFTLARRERLETLFPADLDVVREFCGA